MVGVQPLQSTVDVAVTMVGKTVLVPSEGNPKSGCSVVQPGDGRCGGALPDVMLKDALVAQPMLIKNANATRRYMMRSVVSFCFGILFALREGTLLREIRRHCDTH